MDEPLYCSQVAGCNDHYSINGLSYLNLTCIDCDNIPQMSNISVMWQVLQTVCCCDDHSLLCCVCMYLYLYSNICVVHQHSI